jgi:hypothetical protein
MIADRMRPLNYLAMVSRSFRLVLGRFQALQHCFPFLFLPDKFKLTAKMKLSGTQVSIGAFQTVRTVGTVRQLGNFRYILIPEIINKFMTNISDLVRKKHVMCSS